MGNLFGKHQAHPRRVAAPPAAEVTDHDRAVLDLKNTRDKLSRHRKKADKEAGKLAEQAKILVKEGRKDRALLLLKIKKFKMMHVEKVDMQLFQILQLIDTVEWEKAQVQVVEALRQGKDALNALNEQMPLDEVEALMEETQEAIAYQEEVSNMLAGAFSEKDETDLDAEYENLVASEIAASLPEVPQGEIQSPVLVVPDLEEVEGSTTDGALQEPLPAVAA